MRWHSAHAMAWPISRWEAAASLAAFSSRSIHRQTICHGLRLAVTTNSDDHAHEFLLLRIMDEHDTATSCLLSSMMAWSFAADAHRTTLYYESNDYQRHNFPRPRTQLQCALCLSQLRSWRNSWKRRSRVCPSAMNSQLAAMAPVRTYVSGNPQDRTSGISALYLWISTCWIPIAGADGAPQTARPGLASGALYSQFTTQPFYSRSLWRTVRCPLPMRY